MASLANFTRSQWLLLSAALVFALWLFLVFAVLPIDDAQFLTRILSDIPTISIEF